MEECWNGDGREAVFNDTLTLRQYCSECSSSSKTSSDRVYLQFLSSTLPLQEGEWVECFQAGDRERPNGPGKILKISTDFEDFGTPVYPVFLVQLKGGEKKWYTEVCLSRLREGEKW